MKKLVCLILAACLALMLCACGGETTGDKENVVGLQVGFGRELAMPEGSVLLAGDASMDRSSTGYLDYLYATCIAVTDETGETVLIYTLDLIKAVGEVTDVEKSAISKATGVPIDHIMMAATHTHSAPAIGQQDAENILNYRTIHQEAVVKAAQAALADRSETNVYIGSSETEGLTHTRHYELSNGTYAGSNFGDFNSGTIVGHAGEPDQEVQVIQFERTDEGKKDIILMSFNAHPCFNCSGANRNLISADFVGSTREYIESNTDCLVAYFTGGAGNQTMESKVQSEVRTTDYKEYGAILGQYVIDALSGLVKVEGNDVKISSQTITVQSNKDKVIEYLSAAQETVNAYNAGGSAAANPLVTKYGFSSVHEARAIVTRSKLGMTIDIELNALSVGNGLSFIFAPYEMFGTNSMYIKEKTPYDMTFVVTCANDEHGYLPSDAAFDHGCYEVYVTRCVRGTAESLADTYLEMLTQMKNG